MSVTARSTIIHLLTTAADDVNVYIESFFLGTQSIKNHIQPFPLVRSATVGEQKKHNGTT